MTTTTTAVDVERKTKHFWVGTLETCPRQNATIGGISFPRFSENVKYDERQNRTIRSQHAGAVLELEPEQEKRVREAIERKRVRMSASRMRGWIIDTTDKRYRPRSSDEPLADCVYFREVEPGFCPPFESSTIEAEREKSRKAERALEKDPKDQAVKKEMRERKKGAVGGMYVEEPGPFGS